MVGYNARAVVEAEAMNVTSGLHEISLRLQISHINTLPEVCQSETELGEQPNRKWNVLEKYA
jgi:hypothetical protein